MSEELLDGNLSTRVTSAEKDLLLSNAGRMGSTKDIVMRELVRAFNQACQGGRRPVFPFQIASPRYVVKSGRVVDASYPETNYEELAVAESAQPGKSAPAEELITIVEADHQRRITKVDDNFTVVCGYTFAEVRGMNLREILHGKDTEPGAQAVLHAAMEARHPIETTITNYHKDGSTYRVRLKVEPTAKGFRAEIRLIERLGLGASATGTLATAHLNEVAKRAARRVLAEKSARSNPAAPP